MAVLPRYISAGNRPADGPPYLRTVRPWTADGPPLSRLSSNRTVFGSVGGPKWPADRPVHGGGRSAFKSWNGRRNMVVLSWVSKMTCGPSGPWGGRSASYWKFWDRDTAGSVCVHVLNCGQSAPRERTVRRWLPDLVRDVCKSVGSKFWTADSPPHGRGQSAKGSNGRLWHIIIAVLAVGFEWRTVRFLWGGQSAKTLFSWVLSVTASLGPPSINRGCGRPFEKA